MEDTAAQAESSTAFGDRLFGPGTVGGRGADVVEGVHPQRGQLFEEARIVWAGPDRLSRLDDLPGFVQTGRQRRGLGDDVQTRPPGVEQGLTVRRDESRILQRPLQTR